MEEKKETKHTNKMECPYCHSTNLEMAGVEMGMDTVKRHGEGYKCLACGQFFLFHKAA